MFLSAICIYSAYLLVFIKNAPIIQYPKITLLGGINSDVTANHPIINLIILLIDSTKTSKTGVSFALIGLTL